ncbi:hypothetical protein JAAARDRAFT_47747 [Jaapia argillacea MUCL 33604]|uniref:CNH domain-containing protein n=1 Tax=Jaapia argillacea MUCL 33604 TaxID=933084 RepID=A0A067PQI2_9AGAM|nr:hypothetical protein JAAARDRAFT_47747 [Jaapia argillacea MUCL 33604]
MSTAELRQTALRVARLDAVWSSYDHRPIATPHSVFTKDTELIRLLPGGEWILLVSSKGGITLQSLEAPDVSVSHEGNGSTLEHITCSIVQSESHDALVLLTGEDEEGNNILVLYGVAFDVPSLSFLTEISLPEPILAAAASSDLVVYACPNDEDEVVYCRSVGSDGAANQITMSISCMTTFQDSTFSVLGSNRLLVSNSYGLFIFDIPDLQGHVDVMDVVSVPEAWSLGCDILVYPPVVSPVLWSNLERAMVVMDQNYMHILYPSTSPTARTVPLPIRNGANVEAIGFRRAIWWNALETPPRNFAGFVIRMCTFPRVKGGDHLENATGIELEVKIGGLFVSARYNETPESLSFEEWSGKVCVLLRGGVEGRRVVILSLLA